ncbi:MAG: aconitate hydratase, partial [Salinisphaera sp.]|nr:aconitate hydratase [Salinisphaera sp.]
RQNLVNFGVLPLTFANADDYDQIEQDAEIEIDDLHGRLQDGDRLSALVGDASMELIHGLSPRQVEVVIQGGLINWMRERG